MDYKIVKVRRQKLPACPHNEEAAIVFAGWPELAGIPHALLRAGDSLWRRVFLSAQYEHRPNEDDKGVRVNERRSDPVSS
jgi:hypothetical protein